MPSVSMSEAMPASPTTGLPTIAGAGVSVVEAPASAKLLLRLTAEARARADRELGLVVPLRPLTSNVTSRGTCLWLGPDEWLIVLPAEAAGPGGAISELERALEGLHRSIVDVGANRAAIALTGRDRHDVLSKGCGLDLHPRSWRAGSCAQTLLARVPVILQERDADTRVFVRASYLGYVTAWLERASG